MKIDKKSIVENIISEVSNSIYTDNEEIVFNENSVIYGDSARQSYCRSRAEH